MNNWQAPLDRANEIRLARAALKHRIRARGLALPDVLDPHVALPGRDKIEETIANMPLEALVASAPRVGAARFAKLWADFSGQPYPKHGLRVRHLSADRRAQFAAFLRVKRVGRAAA